MPRRKLTKLSDRLKGKKKPNKKKSKDDEYEKDDFLVSDDEGDYDEVLINDEGKIILPDDAAMPDAPGDAAFMRNNPNPSYGLSTIGFSKPEPAVAPAPVAAMPAPIALAPAVPKPAAPGQVNMLGTFGRKVVREQLSIAPVDPFESAVAAYPAGVPLLQEELPNI
jgi:hypothetical protein